MKPIMYFGHPINAYGIPLEAELLAAIAEKFPNWEILNPNQPQHDAGYKKWKDDTGKGMDYYFKVVLPGCDAGIFLPFRDGAWGAGVYGEAKFLADRGCPIYAITHEGVISSVRLEDVRELTVDETRARIRAAGAIAPY